MPISSDINSTVTDTIKHFMTSDSDSTTDETPSRIRNKIDYNNPSRLIKDLIAKVNNDRIGFEIRSKKWFLRGLNELNDMIGNDSIKGDIIGQLMYIVDQKKRGEDIGNVMLNTCLYGSPGTGKTMLGRIMAKIWYGLGALKGNDNYKDSNLLDEIANMKTHDELTRAFLQRINGEKRVKKDTLFWIFFFVIVIYILYIIAIMMKNVGQKQVFTIFAVAIVIGLIAWWTYSNIEKEEEFKISRKDDITTKKEVKDIIKRDHQVEDDDDIDENKIVRVVSKGDFVAEYVGQSAPKTRKLLESSRGMCLVCDEFYEMRGDNFSTEALAEMIKFMSENPKDIVIIIIGYKDKLLKGPFKEQPGLHRRCMWHFDCPGYNYSELYNIFILQMGKKYRFDDYAAVKRIFKSNHSAFRNYGGDTERLTNYVKVENAKDRHLHGSSEIITTDQVKRAIAILYKNNSSNPDDSDSSDIDKEDIKGPEGKKRALDALKRLLND